MKDLGTILLNQGFKYDTFEVQDDLDGRGPYIRAWNNAAPCPFPDLIREPVKPEPAEAPKSLAEIAEALAARAEK